MDVKRHKLGSYIKLKARWLGALWSWVSVICIFASPALVRAVEVEGLYDVSVLVSSQSAAQRRAASQDALAEVIVRVAGQSSLLQERQIQQLLQNPNQYLISYSYRSTDQEIYDDQNSTQAAQQLHLSFDGAAIGEYLKNNGFPVWSENRPQILVWWVTEENGDRFLVNAESMPEVAQLILANGHRRGLALDFPLLDIQDASLVNEREVWGFFKDPVLIASRRYGAPAVLLGRSWRTPNKQWQGTWLLEIDNQEFWYDGEGEDLQAILSMALDFTADSLGAKYAIINKGDLAPSVQVTVSNIKQLKDYADLQRYLEQLSAVRSFRLQMAEADWLRYELELDTDIQQLKQFIRLDHKLSIVNEDYSLVTNEPTLEFKWNGS